MSSIIFLIDTSYKMKIENSDGKTSLEKAFTFLRQFCKRSDNQPAYFNRVRIIYGNQLIELQEGRAEEDFEKFLTEGRKQAHLVDFISFWKTSFDTEKTIDPTFFVLTSYIEEETLRMFKEYENNVMFMDFAGQRPPANFCKRFENYECMETSKLELQADEIHEHFLSDYLTEVNIGLPFNAEFYNVSTKSDYLMNISKIQVCGMTTSVPIEGFPILARSFLMPVDNVYNNVGNDELIDNETAYEVLKSLLGEDNEKHEGEAEQKDKQKEENEVSIKAEKIEPEASAPASGTAQSDTQENPAEVKQETEPVPVETVGEKKDEVVEASISEPIKQEQEPDEDDEEYTPTKRRGGKRGAKSKSTPAKRVKLTKPEPPVTTPKRATRSSTRNKKIEESLEKVEEEHAGEAAPPAEAVVEPEATVPAPSDAAPPAEQANPNNQTEATGEQEKKPEVVEEVFPEPTYLLARAVERHSGKQRPVIIRLRGLLDEDKTFYDEETLQKLEQEKAAKLAEEAAALIGPAIPAEQAKSAEFGPPASPDFDAPASPDMAPIIPQEIKVIPVHATPVKSAPTQDVDMRIPIRPAQDVDFRIPVAQDVDMRTPASPVQDEDLRVPAISQDVDYRTPQTIKIIPLEPVDAVSEGDAKKEETPKAKKTRWSSGKEADVGEQADTTTENVEKKDDDVPEEPEPATEEPTESCIADIPEEIEEPTMDEMITNQQDTIKCIPIESEADREKRKIQEETADGPPEKQPVYLEVIVLDITWEQFKDQVAVADDEEAAEQILEREKTVTGEKPSHDYEKLPGWYSGEAMQFYVNKLIRSIRKLQDRSSLFEKEIENLTRIVTYSQSREYAGFFANLIRDECTVLQGGHFENIGEQFAGYMLQMGEFVDFVKPATPTQEIPE